MSNLNKIIKQGLNDLFETKGFEDMEVAFGVKQKSDNLSDEEKNQFGPMGQLKDQKGSSFNNPKVVGTKTVDKANAASGKEAQAYYKELAKKIKDYQTPNDKEKFEAPKVPTNAKGENERLKTTGYDVGVSGMEVVADKAAEDGGTEETKKVYKDRLDKLNGKDSTYTKLKKNARDTNKLKYDDDARNTRPVKSQKSKQPEQPEKMKENIYYRDIDTKNIFKANGKLISEEQVLKLVNKIPSRVKVDETKFAITDGETTYKLIWEGDIKTGEAIITNFKNNGMVNEDIEKMKYLWGFKSGDAISTKKNITESGDDAFKRMYKLMKEEGSEEIDMVKTLDKAILHHAEELAKEIEKNPEIAPWVIAKLQRSSTDVADVTHYIDGQEDENEDMEQPGMFGQEME